MWNEKWLGLTDYQKALDLMGACQSNQVLGLEHPATVTLGKRAVREVDLLPGYESHNLKVFQVERGGQATLHSPGQLVIYPLLDLARLNLRPRPYIELLTETTAQCLRELGISIKEGSCGVYTQQGKIAFVGVRIRKGRSQHGLSINVSNDLSLFQHLRPCGSTNPALTSLSHEGASCTTEGLFWRWCKVFKTRWFLTSTNHTPNLGRDLRGELRA
jgi:lipoyl(octanoyl) transferase